jgi:hypothetical protein
MFMPTAQRENRVEQPNNRAVLSRLLVYLSAFPRSTVRKFPHKGGLIPPSKLSFLGKTNGTFVAISTDWTKVRKRGRRAGSAKSSGGLLFERVRR